ncbi:heme oxygenase-like protein [Aspergillus indologenus CBS 114.80]|uniref:Heme oxygenase-like protein n=1 Tax=Aspergillus indologenus CBS 114.80 TaxID=1450541 RepID=A0A2V5IFU1_9EURO|nr:heme oxygenase-like protein [Aspergillus indologenus CBS 114.80]
MPLTTTLQALPLPPPTTFATATSATAHPFLAAAAAGTLPKPRLSAWLAQDRLYIHAYIRFIGALLAKLHLPVAVALPHHQTNSPQHNHPPNPPANEPETETLESQTLHTLTAALTNIVRELDFFRAVAAEYALDLQAPFPAAAPAPAPPPPPAAAGAAGAAAPAGTCTASPITTAYTDLFVSAGSAGTSLLEGLVVLWATEVCYLTVWRNVRDAMGPPRNGEDADGGALREKLVPNWTGAEFEAFVAGIARLVDAVAEREVARSSAPNAREEVVERCARWWRQVVWLEGQFWPDI